MPVPRLLPSLPESPLPPSKLVGKEDTSIEVVVPRLLPANEDTWKKVPKLLPAVENSSLAKGKIGGNTALVSQGEREAVGIIKEKKEEVKETEEDGGPMEEDISTDKVYQAKDVLESGLMSSFIQFGESLKDRLSGLIEQLISSRSAGGAKEPPVGKADSNQDGWDISTDHPFNPNNIDTSLIDGGQGLDLSNLEQYWAGFGQSSIEKQTLNSGARSIIQPEAGTRGPGGMDADIMERIRRESRERPTVQVPTRGLWSAAPWRTEDGEVEQVGWTHGDQPSDSTSPVTLPLSVAAGDSSTPEKKEIRGPESQLYPNSNGVPTIPLPKDYHTATRPSVPAWGRLAWMNQEGLSPTKPTAVEKKIVHSAWESSSIKGRVSSDYTTSEGQAGPDNGIYVRGRTVPGPVTSNTETGDMNLNHPIKERESDWLRQSEFGESPQYKNGKDKTVGPTTPNTIPPDHLSDNTGISSHLKDKALVQKETISIAYLRKYLSLLKLGDQSDNPMTTKSSKVIMSPKDMNKFNVLTQHVKPTHWAELTSEEKKRERESNILTDRQNRIV